MPIITLSLVAALTLGLPPAQPHSTPHDLTLVAGSDEVVADFGKVEFYPNLKSKFGLGSNSKREEVLSSIDRMAELAPGLVCSNLEFDYWHKWKGEAVPALDLVFETPGDITSRPLSMSDTPTRWMSDFEAAVSGLDAAMLVQLTGAPPQYQPEDGWGHDVHPAPTDLSAAAALMGAWTSAEKHGLPILWSLWNEPGHTLGGVGKLGDAEAPQSKAEKAAAKEAAKAARKQERQDNKGKTGDKADRKGENTLEFEAIRSDNAAEIADIYDAYHQEMRPQIGQWSRFGLASFISSDFNPERGTESGRVFFDDVMQRMGPTAPVDFLSFNSFNGAWSVILNGARALSGPKVAQSPLIFTQYAPFSMKYNPDGSTARTTSQQASPMQVAIDTLEDYVAMTRATDVQHICMSYWIGGASAFLDGRKDKLHPTSRFNVMRLYMQLPVQRMALELPAKLSGLGGLAGLNQGKAAVLIWNSGDRDLSVPLRLDRLPATFRGGPARLTVLDDDDPAREARPYDGGAIRLPAHGVALVEVLAPQAADPLLRRNALDGSQGKAVFLQARSTPDRMSVPCGPEVGLPGADGCTGNTGTYGFFDSVRSAAWLGVGQGGGQGGVTAVYRNLPERVLATFGIALVGDAAPNAAAIGLTADFLSCDVQVVATPLPGENGILALDFGAIPQVCRAGDARLRFTLSGVPAGTQAEILLSADPVDARALAQGQAQLHRPDTPELDEGLVVVKPRAELD